MLRSYEDTIKPLAMLSLSEVNNFREGAGQMQVQILHSLLLAKRISHYEAHATIHQRPPWVSKQQACLTVDTPRSFSCTNLVQHLGS